MNEKTQLTLTLIEILIAIGTFKGLEIFIKHLINRKKTKTKDLGDIYKEFAENTDKYMKQTEDMQTTITDLRNESLCMGRRLIEMDKKLDEKNQIIISLKNEVHTLNDETQKLKTLVTDLLKSKEVLEDVKCERVNCETRIPPKKTTKIKAANA